MGKSGSSGGGATYSNTPDYAYNSRMAAVAEQSQNLSNEEYNFWSTTQAPLEAAQASAALSELPSQTALDLANIQAQTSLVDPTTQLQLANIQAQQDILPGATAKTIAQNAATTSLIPQATDVTSQYLQAASQGVDPEDYAQKAGADAKMASNTAMNTMTRNAQRVGLDPTSGSFLRAQADASTTAALNNAAATTAGRQSGVNTNWNRLSGAASTAAGII